MSTLRFSGSRTEQGTGGPARCVNRRRTRHCPSYRAPPSRCGPDLHGMGSRVARRGRPGVRIRVAVLLNDVPAIGIDPEELVLHERGVFRVGREGDRSPGHCVWGNGARDRQQGVVGDDDRLSCPPFVRSGRANSAYPHLHGMIADVANARRPLIRRLGAEVPRDVPAVGVQPKILVLERLRLSRNRCKPDRSDAGR